MTAAGSDGGNGGRGGVMTKRTYICPRFALESIKMPKFHTVLDSPAFRS